MPSADTATEVALETSEARWDVQVFPESVEVLTPFGSKDFNAIRGRTVGHAHIHIIDQYAGICSRPQRRHPLDYPSQGQVLVTPMASPSPERQIEFLTNLQRLLSERLFRQPDQAGDRYTG